MSSLGIAPPDVKDVTLSVFGGRLTDVAPSDLPEGLTPDEQDGIYLPGEWGSRPGLARLYAQGVLTAGTSVLYQKTYMQPNDDPLTLILTSDGKLWVEDVGLGTPPASVAQISAGLCAQSVTQFGREYIAISDLLHGQGVPLQFDGTNLDRVTQDGPAQAPVAADEIDSYVIAAVGVPGIRSQGTLNILSITSAANIATLTLQGAVVFSFTGPGSWLNVAGATVVGYNGIWQVLSFHLIGGHGVYTFAVNQSGLAANGAVGTAASGDVTVTTTTNTDFTAGQNLAIAGAGVAGYNGTWVCLSAIGATVWLSTKTSGVLANSGGGTLTAVGSMTLGTHGIVQMFLTRQGALTKPSPVGYWTSAGGLRAIFGNLAIGPPNVVARVIGMTGAGGFDFFTQVSAATLPNAGGSPIVVKALVVPDNTSTNYVFDISDNALFSGIPIDQPGNDLFDQVVLGPVLGFFGFASRLACWGDYNKVENFLNEGFEGGWFGGAPTVPLGWTIDTAGGTLAAGGSWASGQCWQIQTDNTGNPNGRITQPAYQDSFGDAILEPLTKYIFRAWIKINQTNTVGNANVVAEFYSPTNGVLATATIPVPTSAAFAGGFFAQAAFSAATPAAVFADTVLRLSANSAGFLASPIITIDDWEIDFAEDPYRDALSRWSYVNDPEGFAQTTGNLGAEDDSSPLRCFALLRQSALLESAEGVHSFSDNNGEPGTWSVGQITRAVGGLSLRSGDPGKFGTGDAAEDWALVASKNGVYLFAGAEFWKVSQEISRNPGLPKSQDPRKCWDDINWAAEHTIVAKNDPSARRAYFAVPINGAVKPNVLFVLDYREMDTATQIAGASPLHITLQGKMKTSDLTRKWSVWNIAANDIEILVRAGNEHQLVFGGGLNAANQAFGNIYTLDPANLADDDYGAIAPYYTTYFFTDHDTEQELGLGTDLKLVKRIHAFVTGVGQVTITPIVNSLYNFMPSLTPRLLSADTNQGTLLKSDLEWTPVGLRGQRIAFRISVQPLPGATDVRLRLQKFVVGMMKDPVAAFRQSGV